MYIIDGTYFTRELSIPGVAELRSNSTTELNLFIDEKSRLLLQDALGNVLFNDFDSNVIDGVLDVGAPQRWLNLVNGVDYTFAGEDYTWQGLKFDQGAYKKSLISYFVYYHWLEDQVSEMTTLGEVRGKAKNTLPINSTQRLVSTWNTFVRLYQGGYDRHYNHACRNYSYNPTTYYKRGIRFYDYFGGNDESGFVSLITFLIHNKEDYPDANLEIYEFQNQMGL